MRGKTTHQPNAPTRLTTVPTRILACVAFALVVTCPSLYATDAGQGYTATPGVEITGHRASVRTMQFIPPAGRSVLTSSYDSLMAWHTARPSYARRLSEGSRLIGNAVSPDGSRVAVTAASGARILDVRSGRVTLEFDQDLLPQLLYPAWSPTGNRLSTQTRTHVNIWNPDTGELLRSIDLDGLGRRGVPALAWSPTGERIAILGVSGTLRVYRVPDGAVEFEAQRHQGVTRHLRWSRDGRLIATAGNDGAVNLWSTSDWTPHRSIENEVTILLGRGYRVDSIEFSMDGDRIAASLASNNIRVWSTSSGEEIARWPPDDEDPSDGRHAGQVRSMAFSPDARFLLTGSLNGTIRVWDMETGERAAALESFWDAVRAGAWSQDGMRYGAASSDGTVRIWDSASHAEITRFQGHDRGTVVSMSHAPSVARFATAGEDGTVRIWQSTTGHPLFEVERFDGVEFPRFDVAHLDGVPWPYNHSAYPLQSVSYSPQSNKIAILFGRGTGNSELQIRDVTLDVLAPIFVRGCSHETVAWSPEGQHLAAAGSPGIVIVDTKDPHGREVWRASPELTAGDVFHAAWSGDGERVLTASENEAAAWDWRTGSVVTAVRPQGEARYVEESADGSMLLTAGGSLRAPVVQIWDVPTEAELARVEARPGEQLEARFVASGSRLVVRKVRSRPAELGPTIWDARTGEPLFALEGHSARVVAMALSSDRQLIATASSDRQVRIWRAVSGESVAVMEARLASVRGLVFGPGDGAVAAFGIGGAQSWTIHPQPASATP